MIILDIRTEEEREKTEEKDFLLKTQFNMYSDKINDDINMIILKA